MFFDVCNDCSAGLSSDDWSHLDYHDNGGETAAMALASVETMGPVTPVDTVGYAPYCFVCAGAVYGGTKWERV